MHMMGDDEVGYYGCGCIIRHNHLPWTRMPTIVQVPVPTGDFDRNAAKAILRNYDEVLESRSLDDLLDMLLLTLQQKGSAVISVEEREWLPDLLREVAWTTDKYREEGLALADRLEHEDGP